MLFIWVFDDFDGFFAYFCPQNAIVLSCHSHTPIANRKPLTHFFFTLKPIHKTE